MEGGKKTLHGHSTSLRVATLDATNGFEVYQELKLMLLE